MRKSIAGLGLLLLVPACATTPDRPPPPPGPQVFVSPFGEPFKAGPGEPYPVAAWFSGADTDGDDALSPAEFSADGDRWFARLDGDGDHTLNFSEITRYEQEVVLALRAGGRPGRSDARPAGQPSPRSADRPSLGLSGKSGQQGPSGGGDGRRGRRGGQGRDSSGSGGGGGGGGGLSLLATAGLLSVPEPVKSADINFDQKVTVDEWHATADRWFRLLDTNQDGRLLRSELPQTAIQRGEGRQGRGQGRGQRGPN